jgi:phage shock protein C
MNIETFNWTPIIYMLVTGLLFVFGPVISAMAVRFSLPIFWQWSLAGICIIYGIFPLLLASGSSSLAKYLGCTTQLVMYACPGNRWFETLMSWGLAPWAAIWTVPSGLFGSLGLLFSISMSVRGKQTPFIYRSRRQKVFAGVCAAIAERTGLSLLGVRIGMVVSAVLLSVIVPVLYCWMWLAFPLAPSVDVR